MTDVKILVHCRKGSLEIEPVHKAWSCAVHCRTGSLEINALQDRLQVAVHCRTGSLEIRLSILRH